MMPSSKVFLKTLSMILIIQLSLFPFCWSTMASVNNQSENLEPGLHSEDLVELRGALAVFNVVSGVIGVVGSVLSAFGMGWSFASAPKATTDDIMKELKTGFSKVTQQIDKKFNILDNKIDNVAYELSALRGDVVNGFRAMDSQFDAVHNELQTIYKTLQELELGLYSNVEIAVKGALSDIRYNSSLDILKRATTLCDQLNFFMGGLLGTNTFATDILKLTVSQNECSSKSLNDKLNQNFRGCFDNKNTLTQCSFSPVIQKMDTFFGIMSLGFIGLGFYSKLIGPSFNGQARLVNYLSQKDNLIKRIQTAQQVCMQAQEPYVLSKKVIDGIISNYNLSQSTIGMKTISTPADVSNAFYAYLDNFYLQNDSLNWLIYVVSGTKSQFSNIWFANYIYGGLFNGEATNGNWTIFWAVNNGLPRETLTINENNLDSYISYEPFYIYWKSSELPGVVATAIESNWLYFTEGRSPSILFVFAFYDFPNFGSIGNPIRGKNTATISQPIAGTTNLTNVYYSGRFSKTEIPPFFGNIMESFFEVVIQ